MAPVKRAAVERQVNVRNFFLCVVDGVVVGEYS
jgi:hypothetical protein